MFITAHAVGDNGRHQGFNGAQHGDGDGGRDQGPQQVDVEARNYDVRQARRNSAKAGTNGFNGQSQQPYQSRAGKKGNNISGYALQITAAKNNSRQSNAAKRGFSRLQGMKIPDQGFHAFPEFARNLVDFQTKKVFDLRTGNDDRDAVGESHDHRTWNELDRGSQPGDAQHHQHDPGEQGAHI